MCPTLLGLNVAVVVGCFWVCRLYIFSLSKNNSIDLTLCSVYIQTNSFSFRDTRPYSSFAAGSSSPRLPLPHLPPPQPPAANPLSPQAAISQWNTHVALPDQDVLAARRDFLNGRTSNTVLTITVPEGHRQSRPQAVYRKNAWSSFRQRHLRSFPSVAGSSIYDVSTSSDVTVASDDVSPMSEETAAPVSQRNRSRSSSHGGSSQATPPGGPTMTLQNRMASAAEQAAQKARQTTTHFWFISCTPFFFHQVPLKICFVLSYRARRFSFDILPSSATDVKMHWISLQSSLQFSNLGAVPSPLTKTQSMLKSRTAVA